LSRTPSSSNRTSTCPTRPDGGGSGSGCFLVATVGAARIVRRKGADLPAEVSSRVDVSTNVRRLTWIAYAAIPSALLIGVTTDISTDIAAVPLLWIGPLVVYLATLILAYARPTPIGLRAAAVALLPLGLAVALRKLGVVALPIGPSIVLLLVTLAAAGLALHGRLAAARPVPAHLTEYSLFVALGGAIGGIAAGILAPLVFVIPIEGLLVLATAVVLATPTGWWRVLAVPVVAALGVAVVATIVGPPGTIRVDRSFYGVYRVAAPAPDLHILYSGTTIHGRETFSGPYAGEPLSYYHRAGPLGEVIASLQADHPTMRIGAVGLGAGAIAAYGRPGDTYRFFEIDPTVVSIARDPASFTFLADSAAAIDIDVEDGRLGLEASPPDAFDLLVLDAFSSDAGSGASLDDRIARDLDAHGHARWGHRGPHLESIPGPGDDRRGRRACERVRVDHRQRSAVRGARGPCGPVAMGHRRPVVRGPGRSRPGRALADRSRRRTTPMDGSLHRHDRGDPQLAPPSTSACWTALAGWRYHPANLQSA
jgi:hypothetical protein